VPVFFSLLHSVKSILLGILNPSICKEMPF